MPFKEAGLSILTQLKLNEHGQGVKAESHVERLPITGLLAKTHWTLGLNIFQIANMLSQFESYSSDCV